MTCVDKANVFKAFAFFREMFDEAAKRHPDVKADRLYVDACSAMLVKRPWDFDVMVMENMFGDILSDMTAGLIGGDRASAMSRRSPASRSVQLARHGVEARDDLVAARVHVVEHRGATRRVEDVGTVAEDVVDRERAALVRDDRAQTTQRREMPLLRGQRERWSAARPAGGRAARSTWSGPRRSAAVAWLSARSAAVTRATAAARGSDAARPSWAASAARLRRPRGARAVRARTGRRCARAVER